MALTKDLYTELEDVVGSENISTDGAILEAYTSSGGFGARGAEPEDRYYTIPAAVVLPGSTAEVQAILKWANRRGYKYRAFSTGYGISSILTEKNELSLDMRRMNRILEIDYKNMYAVVEPYVCFAQLQGEAQKMGLNCHVIGAGSNCSALASTTSLQGTSTQAISHGWGGRNALGVEWVIPTGEIIRLGAAGSGAGWFSGDGPGPSMRGIMRGHAGAQSGLGVFTKVAIHLHPWPGPEDMKLKGVSPYYEAELPPTFEYRVIGWPSWQQCADAHYKIGEARIAFAFHKSGGPGTSGQVVTGNNNEYYEKWEELKGLPWVSYGILMAGASAEEHDYQVKTLNRIVEETGGFTVALGEKDIWKKRDYINMVRGCFIPRLAFRPAGAFACPLSGSESIDSSLFVGLSMDDQFRKKYDDQHLLLNDGNNGMWSVDFDNGHFSLFECGHMYNITETDSFKAGRQMLQEGHELGFKTPFSMNWILTGNDLVRIEGPQYQNVQQWQYKIKEALDPCNSADPAGYISLEDKKYSAGRFVLEKKKE
jgi:glycolate oxidase